MVRRGRARSPASRALSRHWAAMPGAGGNAGPQFQAQNGGGNVKSPGKIREFLQDFLPQFQGSVSFRRAKSHGGP